MKILLGFALIIFVQTVWANDERVYQYRPDGSRDWSANYYGHVGNDWLPYRLDGARD